MIRTLDPEPFNRIARHPEVRPWLGGSGEIELKPLVTDLDNFCFLTDDEKGGYIYHQKSAGLYEVHTLALPSGRGREMLRARDESLAFMFLRTDAIEITTIVPDGNAGADAYSAHAGFRETFRRDRCFYLIDGLVGASYRSLGYADWVSRNRDNREAGQVFHAAIHQIVPDDHGEDPIHDCWAGATARALDCGNAPKAVALYNRWCAHSGYLPITLRTLNPLVLDIGTAILQYDGDGWVLLSPLARSASLPENEAASCLSESQQPLLA